MTLTAVPAQHWSMRTPWNRIVLWCGWVFEGRHHRFWFSGDTGSPELLLIPERLARLTLPRCRLGVCPTLVHGCTSYGSAICGCVVATTGCPLAFPIHWGVFELADESLDEPVQELNQALDNLAPVNDSFRILKIGEYLSF
jgi:L-ascorbate metabolism protein UlaG (beta-lactamase superfamily)